MEIILLEKVRNLGNIGDKVKVKAGYGRNYLLPKSKATLATKENLAKFQERRAELEQAAATMLSAAQERAQSLANVNITIPVKVSEEGKLFGSVGIREIVIALETIGHKVDKSEISLPDGPIHQVGDYSVDLLLHSDVTVPIKITILAE